MRFLHCSDVHVTQDYFSSASPLFRLGWRRWIALLELKFGGRAAQYARAAETLAQILRDGERHRVDHVVISGDLTAYGTPAEYQRAHEVLGPLAQDPQRLSVIPGNHDTYTPGTMASRRFERCFGSLLGSDLPEYVSEGPFPFVRLLGEEAAVVGLRSARVPHFPGLSYGVVGKAQLESLRAIVQDPRLAGRGVLVAVHHAPLARSGKPDKRLHGLVDAKELLEILPGPRFAVLHGHIHHRYQHPATAARPAIFGAGSSTMAGREGYWVIEVRGGRVVGGTLHPVGGAT
ncbi:MAG: metallophosphoesterase family protein [Myxococcaceae bacterium]